MPHRRRREQRTNYRARLRLVKSGKVRAVIRKSGSHMLIEFVTWEQNGDNTLITVSSAQLGKFGWNAPMGNVPAAYLTGLLAGKLAKALNVEEAIADLGMQASTKGSRLYAAVKGLVDAGLKVPHDPGMLPDAKRLGGEHIAAWSPKAGKPAFAAYKVRPADLPKHFAEVKSKIIGGKEHAGKAGQVSK